jgi:hypothetical protein
MQTTEDITKGAVVVTSQGSVTMTAYPLCFYTRLPLANRVRNAAGCC